MEDGYGVWFLERATFIISARSRGPLTCVLVRSGTRVGEGMEKWNVPQHVGRIRRIRKVDFIIGRDIVVGIFFFSDQD